VVVVQRLLEGFGEGRTRMNASPQLETAPRPAVVWLGSGREERHRELAAAARDRLWDVVFVLAVAALSFWWVFSS